LGANPTATVRHPLAGLGYVNGEDFEHPALARPAVGLQLLIEGTTEGDGREHE
jgi:hypothetical protein